MLSVFVYNKDSVLSNIVCSRPQLLSYSSLVYLILPSRVVFDYELNTFNFCSSSILFWSNRRPHAFLVQAEYLMLTYRYMYICPSEINSLQDVYLRFIIHWCGEHYHWQVWYYCVEFFTDLQLPSKLDKLMDERQQLMRLNNIIKQLWLTDCVRLC